MNKIGKYEDLERIGRGAMGVVYRAYDPFLERPVAIKTMTGDFEGEPELLDRFFREARVAVQLKHPNIIDVHDLAEEDGKAYIVMELLDGQDLRSRLKRKAPMSLEDRLHMMMDICDALAYAHEREVVHRDLKPGNIQITASGKIKILDFGLARIADSEMTATGMVMGTPSYMSPEQLEGERVDHRSDIFSLGAVFYELLSYRKPFEGRSLAEAFAKIAKADPVPLHEMERLLPEELSTIIGRCLQKKREDRYQSTGELREDLRAFRDSLAEMRRDARHRARDAVERLLGLRRDNQKILTRLQEIDALRAAGSGDPDDTVHAGLDATLEFDPAETDALLGEDDEASQRGYLELSQLRESAEIEFQRLQELLSTLRPIVEFVGTPLDEHSGTELDEIERRVATVLGDDPGNSVAEGLRARVEDERERRLEQERQARIASSLEAATDARDAGDLERARDLASRVLDDDPEHDAASTLLAEIEQEIQRLEEQRRLEQERQARIASNLEAATDARDAGDLEQARDLASRVLDDDPEHDAASTLLAEIEQEIQRLEEQRRLEQERQARIASNLEAATDARDAGDLERARDLASRVLDDDPEHDAASTLLAEIEQEIQRLEEQRRLEQERQARIASNLEAATDARDAGDLEQARDLASRVLDDDPEHDAASTLLAEIDHEIQRLEEQRRLEQERQARIASNLEAATDARDAGDLEQARDLAARVLDDDPEHDAASTLLAEIDHEIQRLEEQRRLEAERQATEEKAAAEREAQARRRAEAEREAEAEGPPDPEQTVAMSSSVPEDALDTLPIEGIERSEVLGPEADTETAPDGATTPADAPAWEHVPRWLLATARERPLQVVAPLAAFALVVGLFLIWPDGSDTPPVQKRGVAGTGQPGSEAGVDSDSSSRPGTTGDSPSGTEEPSPGPPGDETGTDIDARLALAEEHLENDRFEEALTLTGSILEADPGNSEARALDERARAALGDSTATGAVTGLEQARAHLDAGRYQDAVDATEAVLSGQPDHGEAQDLLSQARTGVEMVTTRSAANQARERAEAADAPGLANDPFQRAADLEEDARGLVREGALEEATERFRRAASGFEEAARTAMTAADPADTVDAIDTEEPPAGDETRGETTPGDDTAAGDETADANESLVAEARAAAERAQQAYRDRAGEIEMESPVWGGDAFSEARAAARNGESALAQGEHAAAVSHYEEAGARLEQATAAALDDLRSRVEGAAGSVSAEVPQADELVTQASRHRSAGDHLAAARSLALARTLYEEAAAITAVMDRYRRGFREQSIATIRTVYPDIEGTPREDGIRRTFDEFGAVELSPTAVSLQIDPSRQRAQLVWTVVYRAGGTEQSRRQSVDLQKTADGWRIIDILLIDAP